MIEKMSEHEEDERKSAAGSQQGISLAEAVAANTASQLPPMPNAVFNGQGVTSNDVAGLSMGGVDRLSVLKKQQGHQLLAARLLLQQQQQDEAILAAAGGGPSLLGAHPFLGSSSPSSAGLQQATLIQNQQLNLLRAQVGLMQSGRGMRDVGGVISTQKGANPNSLDSKLSSYYDASEIPDPQSDDEEEEHGASLEAKGEDQLKGNKKSKNNAVETFPQKLYRMIAEAENEGLKDVVSFFPHGRAFAIHKPRKFITELMPKYFSTSRMSSFQRQLNLYGFRRITEGRDKGGYFHEFFLKGRKGLCKRIKRKKSSSSKTVVNAAVNPSMAAVPGFGFGTVTLPSGTSGAGLQDAASLYHMQMLQAAGGFTASAGLGAGSFQNVDSGVPSLGFNLVGGGNVRSPGFPSSLDQSSALLEQKQAELLLAQLQLQQQHQATDQSSG